jgi:type I restriction enzyme S subunit
LLEEERVGVINLAVTKGLDLTVPMKDSGIEWLGEIPAHWEVKRMNFISTKIGDGLHGTPNYVDESVFPFINGTNIGEGVIIITDRTKFVSEEEYMSNQKILTSNTILMSINGTIGNLAFYNGESIMLGKSVAYINLESNVNKDFIYYYLKSEIAKDYISMELSGSTIKNLSLYSINKTPIPYPAKDEQHEIVNYIKTKMLEIGTIISKTQQEIELLKEYKTALISEVVTGKVDVREEKMNQQVAI